MQISLFPMIRRLFLSLRRIFRSSRSVVERVALENVNEPAANTTKDLLVVQDHQHPFLNLPPELILLVASFLDPEFQVLLSLSCTRLRLVLGSNLDLSLRHDPAVKVRFLQCLELDYPEYLTCRVCAFMYRWQAEGRLRGYWCPRVKCHSFTDIRTSYSWCMHGQPNIWMTREVVDLIFRAHEQGQRYGLPLSFLNTSGTDYNGITRRNEARLVDGQLLLTSNWEVDSESGEDTVQKARRFNGALCLHWADNIWREKISQYVEQAVEQAVAGLMGSKTPGVIKCPFCATDYKLRAQNSTCNRIRIVLKVWRNYGRRYENMLANEQIFHRQASSRIDANALSQRDLCAVFESSRSGTESNRIC